MLEIISGVAGHDSITIPTPGFTKFITKSATKIAIAIVLKKYRRVYFQTLLDFLLLPRFETPTIMEKNTSGTYIIFSVLINNCPINSHNPIIDSYKNQFG